MKIIDLSIRYSTTIFTLLVVIVIAGWVAYVELPREAEPDVPIPYVNVVVTYEGVDPSDMESLVTLPIERKMKGLEGLKEMTASCSEGSTSILLEFEPDVDIDDALQKVKDKVDLAEADLPEEADDPVVYEINTSQWPVMSIAIVGDEDPLVMKEIAEDLEEVIESFRGVLDVVIVGEVEREIRVEFDTERVSAYRITLPEIVSVVTSNNVNIPGGNMDVGEAKYTIKTPGEFTSPEDAARLPVAVRDGRVVYLGDIATGRDTIKDRISLSRVNGRDAVTIEILKRSGANILELAAQVKAALEVARTRVPPGVEFLITFDNSEDINIMVADLENSILSGLVLVVLVIVFFMGGRNSVFVSLAIPYSMLLAFLTLAFLGFTLNMVVLFSLVLAVGMLVDNAIVIVENIYRHMQMGKDRMAAALDGAQEVAWPVTTSTLTTVAAFMPLLFWPGIVGEFMSFLPKTVIIVLLASLFVALTINPTICSRLGILTRSDRKRRIPGVGEMAASKELGLTMRAYRAFLAMAIDNKGKSVALAVLALLIVLSAYGRWGNGTEFFPEIDPRRASIDVKAPEGTNLERSDELVRRVEAAAQGYPDIDYIITSVGSLGAGGGFESGGSRTNESRVTLVFKEAELRSRKSAEILEEIRGKLHGFIGADLEFARQQGGPPTGKPVNIEITGDDFAMLGKIAGQIRDRIRNTPGLVDLEDDYDLGRPEIRVEVDKERAEILDLDTYSIGWMVRAAIQGIEIGDYREDEDEYDIVARLPEGKRDNLQTVMDLFVPTGTGEPVPLTSVARLTLSSGLGTVRRIDQKRVITVSGEVEGRQADEVLLEVQNELAEFPLPSGYRLTFTGESEDSQEASAFLGKAFAGALMLIALILITQFNSIVKPFIIMTSVILSLMGVFIGLLILGKPFGIIMTGIGVISLAGVVVNNAIVLIDYIEQLRFKYGLPMREALIEAGVVRFRPVLLTAVTTILGLIPMAVGISFDFRSMTLQIGTESSQWWGSMAVAVIFGLTVATVLTLVVVPTLYALLEAAAGLARRAVRLVHRPASDRQPARG